tara:strand:- start:251 stop:520 length:270 start_codon:yes stop_codon:yes gene_type:complete
MELEQLRKEWESIAFKFEEPCKEFRKLEKEYSQKFLEVLKDEKELHPGNGLWQPEFKARDNLKLLDLQGNVKKAYDMGWRGRSFYFSDK